MYAFLLNAHVYMCVYIYAPVRVGWLSGTLWSSWEGVGDGRNLVYSGQSFPGVHPKPVNQMCIRKILSVHVDTRSSILA